MTDFDKMAERFTARVRYAGNWRDNYFGAAYATRIKQAIQELREAIAEAERNEEIKEPQKRPTAEELEAILHSEDDRPITINPDGSITAL